MRYLIIPDIHEKIDKTLDILEQIPKKYGTDKTIFLGDIYDILAPYDPLRTRLAARLHKRLINECIVLWGNHDIQYFYEDVKGIHSSGYHPRRTDIIFDEFGMDKITDYMNKIKFFEMLHNDNPEKRFLISHAGVHSSFLNDYSPLWSQLHNQSMFALMALKRGEMHQFIGAGLSVGGKQPYGGIIWLRDWEMDYIGINQIVGHTENDNVRKYPNQIGNQKFINYCIDTNLHHLAILDDEGNIEIIDI